MLYKLPSYDSIKDNGQISTLAKVIMQGDFDQLYRHLESTQARFGAMIEKRSASISAADRAKDVAAAMNGYVNQSIAQLNGRTPIMLTATAYDITSGYGLAAIKTLKDLGADLDAQDNDGNTALHLYVLDEASTHVKSVVHEVYNREPGKPSSHSSKEHTDRFEKYMQHMVSLCSKGANPKILNKDKYSVLGILRESFLPNPASTLEEEYNKFLGISSSSSTHSSSASSASQYAGSGVELRKLEAQKKAEHNASCCAIL